MQPRTQSARSSAAAFLSGSGTAAAASAGARIERRRQIAQWCLAASPFIFLWAVLINQLRVEWTVNPQYAHGWIVPLLCLSLLFGRWQGIKGQLPEGEEAFRTPAGWLWLGWAALAFLWLPTRLVEEANPEWRMISWLLAFEVIGLTLSAIWLQKGRIVATEMIFPLCFFLVAVPWPTIIEGPLIQVLTRICAGLTIETAGWLNIPAAQHGNVIELANGSVGIDEACSGIRSFQSTLMISLFLGELYGLTMVRRWLLAPIGFVLALLFNVCRTTFLTLVAGRQGVEAIAKYHDPVGVTIMIACLFSIWLLSLLLKQPTAELAPARSQKDLGITPASFALRRWALVLAAWLVVAEAGVELWYRAHEWRVPAAAAWTVQWPRDNPTFLQKPIAEKTRELLRYDEAVTGAWQDDDGIRWLMTYLRWVPGRIAVHLAKVHTPDVCLTAAGNNVQALPDVSYFQINGLRMPFREYVLNQRGEAAYVFYCLWEDRSQNQFFKTELLTYDNRLEPVLAGRRNCGQRSIEIVVQGCADLKQAEQAMVKELDKVMTVGKTDA